MLLIKGAGDIASGIALRLYRAGLRFVMTELAHPTAIRRSVSFSGAVTEGKTQVEGVTARLAKNAHDAAAMMYDGVIPIIIDENACCVGTLSPTAVIDAVLAKRNTGTCMTDAPIVIGIGPGFCAGIDCDAVVETKRGHTLGRVILDGEPQKNTGIPGEIGGYTSERIIRAPKDGVFTCVHDIGDIVSAGETVAYVDGEKVICSISGVLRGILRSGTPVFAGMKSGDVDPRGCTEYCFTVSDKALAVGGGALEAVLCLAMKKDLQQELWRI